jgi:hypothetical protein
VVTISAYKDSITLNKYKKTMSECIKLYYPNIDSRDLSNAIDYSIKKRYKEHPASINNSYTHKEVNTTLLNIADYINKREPITTAFGTMFKHHADEPNPLADVVQSFLDLRSEHKKTMFKYPKGSEEFEHYNLMQQLDKIDANGYTVRFSI